MTLTAADFDFVRTLVRQHAAIVIDPGKEYLVESRLAPLAREHGYGSLSALLAELRERPAANLHRRVVEAMTTNETSFFRDPPSFEALRDVVLPELIARRGAERRLRIWCGAASSGQEPYSVAILLREHFPILAGWQVQILATDIARDVLDRARRGRYSQLEVNRGLPAPLLLKYFTKVGIEWEIAEPIRRMVGFGELNLVEPWPALPEFDLVLLRNVLIYFDVPTKQRVLANVRRVLRRDGTLLLGGAETTLGLDEAFERVPLGRSLGYRLRSR
ncbi:MAG TPA: protein-glutamate O-methyltransferase CheR [Gemmatimonadales bacterium]|nr:protein-glutamate O-methyltransferase CheR [Gemmatimonadales bacterium]